MTSLARWCFRHKFRVLAAWLVALFVIGGLNAGAGSGFTDSFSLPGTESTTALNLLTKNFNTESTDTNQVVFAADDGVAWVGAGPTAAPPCAAGGRAGYIPGAVPEGVFDAMAVALQ